MITPLTLCLDVNNRTFSAYVVFAYVEREHATASIHLRKTEPAARREEAMMRRTRESRVTGDSPLD